MNDAQNFELGFKVGKIARLLDDVLVLANRYGASVGQIKAIKHEQNRLDALAVSLLEDYQ